MLLQNSERWLETKLVGDVYTMALQHLCIKASRSSLSDSAIGFGH